MKGKVIICLLSLFTFTNMLYSQIKSISGNVIDDNGEPLIGVTIVEKGTQKGTITDFDGHYIINNVGPNKILVFSYIGMKSKEVHINGKNVINVTLSPDSELLDEVVVVGYGKQAKVSVTGAISSISDKTIKSAPAPNLISALSGKLPGLVTMQSNGRPGEEDFSMYLRGQSSLNSSAPLILIDGVPRDNITSLDPNEVENVTILKDASATAVFGVRGANGVILITTKIGDTEKPQMNISAETGIQEFTSDVESVDSWQYCTLRNQALINDGLVPAFTERQIQKYKDGNDPYYPNTDWFHLIFKDHASISRYNINLSGKTNRLKYFVNVGMLNQDGMFNTMSKSQLGYDPQFRLDRYNFRGNLDVTAASWLKIGLKLATYIDQVGSPSKKADTTIYQFIQGIYNTSPTIPSVVDPSFGIPSDVLFGMTNVIGELNYQGYKKVDKNKLNSSLSLDLNLDAITKGLTSKVMVSYDAVGTSTILGFKGPEFGLGYNTYLLTVMDLDGQDVNTLVENEEYSKRNMSLRKSYDYTYSFNIQWMLNYKRTFNKVHNFGAMLLAQRDISEGSGSNIYLLPHNVIGTALRATYRYSDRYMAELNAGYNGSEQFAKGKRYGFFPAGSLGWIITNEPFFKRLNINEISNLKIRGSFGKVGNDKISNARFLYLDNNSITSGGAIKNVGVGNKVNEILIGNPNLTWEIAYKQNYGIDLGLFNGQLALTFDLFKEQRRNILISRNSVPSLLGNFQSVIPKANIGKVDNKGYEVEIKYNKQFSKSFSVSLSGNYSYAKNKIIYSDAMYLGDDYAYPDRQTGFSIGQNFGYLIDWNSPGKGYFVSQEEIDSYPTYQTTPRLGDFVYKDLNNDGLIDNKDMAPIGKPKVPRSNYGISIGFKYKSIDFTALFQGIGSSSVYYSDDSGIWERSGFYTTHHMNAWTQERYENGDKITYPALTTGLGTSLTQNDFFISNRKFIRLKNLEIGYTFPKSLMKHVGMRNLRIYANANNLFTWDNLRFKNVDPEMNTLTSVIPLQRIINMGLNVQF